MTPLWLLAVAYASTVEIDGSRWRALQAPDIDKEQAPEPRVLSREVNLDPRTEEVRFDASWTLWSPEKQWFEARITGPGVHVAEASYGGRELAITEAPDGVRVAIELDGKGTLVLRGVAVGDARKQPVALDLLPAAVGRVRVQTQAEPTITALGPVVQLRDGIWSGASGLALQLSDPTPPAPRPDLAIATAAVGVTVGEGSYDAQGRVRWEVRHGELSTVVFDGTGMGADLDVTGPTLASWSRAGNRVTVTLREPEDRLVELALTWSGPVPEGDEAKLALPTLKPQGAFKTESSVQLARDGEVELVPELGSWTAIPFSDLPEWGRGLVVGTPTATYAASGTPGGVVGLFRFTPVAGPPTFVDVATITAAATRDGAVLMRAHYAVRNDRSPHLRVTPPVGAQIVGARVAGETARIAADGRTWLVPLGKSVETVEGLLSFPVEVILLLEEGVWDHREQRAIPIPTVDAPVAVTRATLHLPPGYRSKLDDGEGDVVGAFSQGEGIQYGKGTGQSAQAEALLQEAVQAWMGNAFDDAESLLEELEEMGALDENARKLQSNLDVISGKGEGQYDVALERRVKEQAKARSLEDREAQEAALKSAEQQYLSGDYAAAEQGYRKALDLGEKLDRLEQKESVEEETRNAVVAGQLELAKKEVAKNKEKAEAEKKFKAVAKPASATETVATSDTSTSQVLSKDFLQKLPTGRNFESTVVSEDGDGTGTVYTFSDETIEGDLVKPEAQLLLDGRTGSGGLGTRGSGPGGGGTAEGIGGLGTKGMGSGSSGYGSGGVAGGVVGGVVGGVAGGVVGGELAGANGAAFGPNEDQPAPVQRVVIEAQRIEFNSDLPLEADESPNVDFGRDRELDAEPDSDARYAQADDAMVVLKRQKPGLRLPQVSLGGKDKASADPAPPPPPAAPPDNKPAVRAVQLTAVIPNQGEAVRYEHLLLEAGATYALPIEAFVPRRER